MYVLVRVVLDFKEPFTDVFERGPASDIEDEEGGNGAFVVGSGDGLERLLSCLNK